MIQMIIETIVKMTTTRIHPTVAIDRAEGVGLEHQYFEDVLEAIEVVRAGRTLDVLDEGLLKTTTQCSSYGLVSPSYCSTV